jgi:hypothetical protein
MEDLLLNNQPMTKTEIKNKENETSGMVMDDLGMDPDRLEH